LLDHSQMRQKLVAVLQRPVDLDHPLTRLYPPLQRIARQRAGETTYIDKRCSSSEALSFLAEMVPTTSIPPVVRPPKRRASLVRLEAQGVGGESYTGEPCGAMVCRLPLAASPTHPSGSGTYPQYGGRPRSHSATRATPAGAAPSQRLKRSSRPIKTLRGYGAAYRQCAPLAQALTDDPRRRDGALDGDQPTAVR
jgi:hypothetical protein